ncbi:PREDICTED: uncharacterized protein LOC106806569 [Priapulus caudatus]|uniref:Uncharacterized protein LOC106806569 n=1 Tax=Priapulus caudatus TaxID=37621 RepID=A0ABM1DVS7_PRICU|nr:PREDICTED: uncharacterized protein LOC106806569 [Priapulus caudatus]
MKKSKNLHASKSKRHDVDGQRRPKLNINARGKWQLLSHTVKAIGDPGAALHVTKTITHGFKHYMNVFTSELPIQHVVYLQNRQEYLIVDAGGTVMVVTRYGFRKAEIETTETIGHLVYAEQLKRLVAITPSGNKLLLFNMSLDVVSVVPLSNRAQRLISNDECGEIITCHHSTVTCWVFQHSASYLVQRVVIQMDTCLLDGVKLISLERTASRTQRFYVSAKNFVQVINLHEGKVVHLAKNLHRMNITAMMFFNPLKFIITAAKDGTVKVWNDSFQLQAVFVGHNNSVLDLAVYPYGPLIMSASLDCTIRIWNLETHDQVDQAMVAYPVECIGTVMQDDQLFTYSHCGLMFWKVHHLHRLLTPISSEVARVEKVEYPDFPTRLCLPCGGSTVKIISPYSGHVITTLLLDDDTRVEDTAYALVQGVVFVLTTNGNIVKSNAAVNPCKILKTWIFEESRYTCTTIYQYVGKSSPQYTKPDRKLSLLHGRRVSLSSKNEVPALLLVGREDGCIARLNWTTGVTDFIIKGHEGMVSSLVAHVSNDQLISIGEDSVLKLWRVYPFVEESLAPFMALQCYHTPTHVAAIGNLLCISFAHVQTATYMLTVYDTAIKDRYDHSPEDDHNCEIIAVCSCAYMNIFASASVDGTIRIWNDKNELVRIVELKAVPTALSFCSKRGDLAVGIGKHLHKIHYSEYMPGDTFNKVVSQLDCGEPPDNPLHVSAGVTLPVLHKLSPTHSALFRYTHFQDTLTEEERSEIAREKKQKSEICSSLIERDEELLKIRDGLLTVPKVANLTRKQKLEAFRKYYDLLYDFAKVPLPLDDKIPQVMQQEDVSPCSVRGGFFPSPSKAIVCPNTRRYATNPNGFIPNSVLASCLWKEEVKQKRMSGKSWRPVGLTKAQLAALARKEAAEEAEANCSNDEEEEDEDEEEEENLLWQRMNDEMRISSCESVTESSSPIQTPSPLQQRTPSPKKIEQLQPLKPLPPRPQIPKRVQVQSPPLVAPPPVIRTVAPPPVAEPVPKPVEAVKAEPSPPATAPPLPGFLMQFVGQQWFHAAYRSMKTPSPKKIEQLQPLKPLPPRPQIPKRVQVQSPPLVAPPPVIRTVAPPPVAEPVPKPVEAVKAEPSPPATAPPLPGFLMQFVGQQWFHAAYRSMKTLTGPFTVAKFISLLLKALGEAVWEHRLGIVNGIAALCVQHSSAVDLLETARGLLCTLHTTPPPSHQVAVQNSYITTVYKAVQKLAPHSSDYMAQLIAGYVEGENNLRDLVKAIWLELGLNDAGGYFTRELDSWDVYDKDKDERTLALLRKAVRFIDWWTEQCSKHQLKNPKQYRASPKQKPMRKGQNTQKSPTSDLITPIVAINHFCVIHYEREQRKILAEKKKPERELTRRNKKQLAPERDPKLIRLGHTHKSECHPLRETSLADYAFLTRQLMQSLQLGDCPRFINLPVHCVSVQPFQPPVSKDRGDEVKPYVQLPRQLLARHYFLPQLSCVPSNDAPSGH